MAGRGKDERVLVVLQLTGGNDGLNTVVPFRQDAYYRARPNLGLARGALHALDEDHGLHPAMKALAQQFAAGRVAVVQGIGSPAPDRSHFRSLEMWHTADPFAPAGDIGWLGRLADQMAARESASTPALAIEAGALPLSMRAEHFLVPTVVDENGLQTRESSASSRFWRNRLLATDSKSAESSETLDWLRDASRSSHAAAQRMSEISRSHAADDYPGSELAKRLRLVASLIAGGFGTRLFHLSLNGFDTHSRQAPVHENLLRTFSEAVAAFQKDLESKGVAERVLLFAFSEFGRRVAENGSRGTDHGRGAPAFLVGKRVNAGLHGPPPDLDNLEEGDIQQSVDYRAVYTELERDWMGLKPCCDVPTLGVIG
jgi:uncharacterized protein (DUF1501 family)